MKYFLKILSIAIATFFLFPVNGTAQLRGETSEKKGLVCPSDTQTSYSVRSDCEDVSARPLFSWSLTPATAGEFTSTVSCFSQGVSIKWNHDIVALGNVTLTATIRYVTFQTGADPCNSPSAGCASKTYSLKIRHPSPPPAALPIEMPTTIVADPEANITMSYTDEATFDMFSKMEAYLGDDLVMEGDVEEMLSYTTSIPGTKEFKIYIHNGCGDTFGPYSKTVHVLPSCHDDASGKLTLTGTDLEKIEDGYLVKSGKTYTIGVEGITDFDSHYELIHDGGDYFTLDAKTLTTHSGSGGYWLEAQRKDGRQECPVIPPLRLLLNGEFITIEDNCLVTLPNDLEFEDAESPPDFFAVRAESKTGIVIKPGVTLLNGSELILDYTAPALEDDDPDEELNFIQSTSYDEYNRIIAQSRQYFDDRGLATQSQSKVISENTVMASQVLYDARGRAVISTLPAPVATGTSESGGCGQDVQQASLVQFNYRENFVTDAAGAPYDHTNFALAKEENPDPVGNAQENTLGWYYSDNNSIEPLVATTQFPYSRTLFYHDGSGEVKSATQPGDAFRAGGGHLGTTNNIQVENDDPYLQNYFAIRQNELKLSSPEVYQGNFFKNVSTDAEGRKSVSYIDLGGKAILSLYFGDQTTPITRSYRFYNDVGQLTVSLTPNGWEQYDGSNFDKVDKTTYTYDGRGRMIAMRETDAGETHYVYRNDGSIRFSQNAEQEEDGRYSYTNYDETGRPVESGEYKPGAGGITFQSEAMKAILENETRNGGLSESLGTKANRLETFYDLPDPALPVDRTQRFLDGAVSYTQNSEATTWYSYDGRGRVEWIVQDLGALGIKTLDYRYGPLGNVQEVAYQAEDDDEDFYHFYEYDLDGRLTNVYTSTEKLLYDEFGEVTNREVLTGQAEYRYYLHGPLKRVELAGNLQGIDYIYTANGALKSINHADQAKDPGNDESDVNGFRSDVFGMTLSYYNNDYSGAGYSAGNLSLSGHDEQFTGNIRALSWHSPVDGGESRTYAYDYDDRYQLSGATFGSFAGTGGAYTFTGSPLQAYQVDIPQVDLNGNIKILQRKGELGAYIADFRYNYKENTNKLLNVQHDGSEYSAYCYNKTGQMIRQEKGDEIWYLQYDVTGKVTGVYKSYDEASGVYSRPLAIYTYDDRGFRLSKTNFDDEGNARLKTWYVRDVAGSVVSTYRQNLAGDADPEQYEVPIYGSGRLGMYRPHALLGNYLYELNDHLGNVRAVIGEGITLEYLATMETERDETDYFTINNRIPTAGFINHTPPVVAVDGQEETIASPNEVVRMNNAIAGMQTAIGAAFKTRVYPGDNVVMEVFAKYSNFETNEVDILPTIVSYLESSFGLPATADGPLEIFDFMNAPEFASLAAWSNVDDNQPRAFLNYIVFDDNFQVQDFGVQQVGEEAEIPLDGSAMTHPHQKLILDVTIEKQGYIYVYLSVDDRQNMDVYWDDFKVTHHLNDIVAGGDYYPFGLAMSGRQITRDDYRFGYQGQFSEYDEETGWNSFELRTYDGRIGRFTTKDPAGQFYSPYIGMGNNPVSNVDPTGGVVNPVVDSDGNFLGFDEFGAGGEVIVYDGAFVEGMSQAAILEDGGMFASDFFVANNFTVGQAMDFGAIANQSFKDYINTTALIATGELIRDISFGLSFMTGGGGGRAVTPSRLAARGVGTPTIQFGKSANQISHAFRHTDKLGLSREAVKSAVEKHLRGVSHKIVAGKPFNQIIEVAGQRIQYTAFKLENGVINVGRIHGL